MTFTDALPWYGLALLALAALLLLTVAVVREWPLLTLEWRRVLVVGVIEHGVIAYAALEATRRDVTAEVGALLLILSLIGLVVALALLVLEQVRNPLLGQS